jgi:hypothetical protein
VTAAEKQAAVLRGAITAGRRLGPGEDVTVDVLHRLETLEECGEHEAQLRAEIRAKQWSHRDAALQVQLLVAAIRRVEAIEKLRHARRVLTRGRKTPTVRVVFPEWVTALMRQRRQSPAVALPARAGESVS